MKLRELYEQVKGEIFPSKVTLTIAKSAEDRDFWVKAANALAGKGDIESFDEAKKDKKKKPEEVPAEEPEAIASEEPDAEIGAAEEIPTETPAGVSITQPGQEPEKPVEQPKLGGEGVEPFTTDYDYKKVADYQLEFKKKDNPDGTIDCELVAWHVGEFGAQKGTAKEQEFVASILMKFKNEAHLMKNLEHNRWQIGKIIDQLKAIPKKETPEVTPS